MENKDFSNSGSQHRETNQTESSEEGRMVDQHDLVDEVIHLQRPNTHSATAQDESVHAAVPDISPQQDSGSGQSNPPDYSEAVPGARAPGGVAVPPTGSPPPPYSQDPASRADRIKGLPPPPYDSDISDSVFDRSAYAQRVFLTLFCQLIVTFTLLIFFTLCAAIQEFVQENMWLYYMSHVIFFIPLTSIYCCMWFYNWKHWNLLALVVLTLCVPFMLSLTNNYSIQSVIMATLITVTKYNFSLCFGVTLVFAPYLIIFGIISIFFDSSVVHIIYALLGILVFTCYLSMDTYLMMETIPPVRMPEEYIYAVLKLYLDTVGSFLYFFLFIMRCLMSL